MFFKQSRRAVNQANFNANELGALRLAFPSLEEQRQISKHLLTVERKTHAEQARLDGMTCVFQSLLHHLMTGKIRIYEAEKAVAEVV